MLAKKKYVPLSDKERTQGIGIMLKYLRGRENLSQGELCQRTNMKKQTYANYESGRHAPSIETLIQLSYFYDITLDFITSKSLFAMDKKFDSVLFKDMLLNLTEDQFIDNASKLSTLFENIAYLSVQYKKANELLAAAPDAKQYLEEQFNKIKGL